MPRHSAGGECCACSTPTVPNATTCAVQARNAARNMACPGARSERAQAILTDPRSFGQCDKVLPRPIDHPRPINPSGGAIMKIVVIGGTGLIGSKLVAQPAPARPRGAAAPGRASTRSRAKAWPRRWRAPRWWSTSRTRPRFEDRAVLDFFETAGRNLLAAEAAAGVKHHVALSVVGTDRSPRAATSAARSRRRSDPGGLDPLHDRPFDAVLRVPRRHRAVGLGRPDREAVTGLRAADRV